jgi:hypothetical protein
MKMSPRKTSAQLVASFSAEAKKLGGLMSANQKRFFSVAIAHGKDMEPTGPLAGESR